MVEEFKSRSVTVLNPQGLHARPADLLVKRANQFEADIQIVKDGDHVDAKSILSVLTLAAVQGTRLSIQASGEDAEDALNALSELFESRFGQKESVE